MRGQEGRRAAGRAGRATSRRDRRDWDYSERSCQVGRSVALRGAGSRVSAGTLAGQQAGGEIGAPGEVVQASELEMQRGQTGEGQRSMIFYQTLFG